MNRDNATVFIMALVLIVTNIIARIPECSIPLIAFIDFLGLLVIVFSVHILQIKPILDAREEAKEQAPVISATKAREASDDSDVAFNAIMFDIDEAKDDGYYYIFHTHNNLNDKCKLRLEALGYKVQVGEHQSIISWKQ